MCLIEVLETADENQELYVIRNGEEVASYNGKDSIPNEFNNCKVISVFTYEYGTIVFIK